MAIAVAQFLGRQFKRSGQLVSLHQIGNNHGQIAGGERARRMAFPLMSTSTQKNGNADESQGV